jgi:drug/metabolite transporter (DMT)-like permease
MSPLVTLILAAAILHENVTFFDYTTVLLGFGAVSLITYGMTQK